MCLSLLRRWFLCRKEEPKTTGGIITVHCTGENSAFFENSNGELAVSKDGTRWMPISGIAVGEYFTDVLYLRGTNTGSVGMIYFENPVTLEGDLMWLIDYENGSDTVPSEGFANLFSAVEVNMEITCLAKNASADSFTDWLNPDSTGILHCPAENKRTFPNSYYNLPSGWTIEYV